MRADSKLYWSSVSKYETCPRLFLWSSGWEDIDLGFGPGKRKKVETDRSHAVMGQVIQATLEDFYNTSLWTQFEKDRDGLRRVLGVAARNWLSNYIKKDLLGQKVPLRVDFKEMLETCKAGARGYVDTLEAHGLWGVPAKAEFDMTMTYEGVVLGGRADFLFEPHHGGMVLDGKNTKDKRSVDPDQLRWYGFLYKARYGVNPEKLGFVWYRTPGNSGITWVDTSNKEYDDLLRRAKRVHLRMVNREFAPTPSLDACKWCDFRHECPDRHQEISETLEDGPVGLDGVLL